MAEWAVEDIRAFLARYGRGCEGFPEAIVEAVDLLTRRDGGAYDDFIEQLAPNALARRVKLADLANHLDLLRRSALTRDDFEGLQMRLRAWHRLRGWRIREPDGVTGRCVLP